MRNHSIALSLNLMDRLIHWWIRTAFAGVLDEFFGQKQGRPCFTHRPQQWSEPCHFSTIVLKYIPFYWFLKAHFLISNKSPTLIDLFWVKAINFYRCNKCNRFLPLSASFINNHIAHSHPSKTQLDSIDKVTTVSLTVTSKIHDLNTTHISDTSKLIENTVNELKVNISTK